MEEGVDPAFKRHTMSIVDRRQAIKTACNLAQPGDIVVIAGKGHEKYQEIKGVKTHFDDMEELMEIFKLLS